MSFPVVLSLVLISIALAVSVCLAAPASRILSLAGGHDADGLNFTYRIGDAAPPVVTAQVCMEPADTTLTPLVSPLTSTGTGLFVVVLFPSPPKMLSMIIHHLYCAAAPARLASDENRVGLLASICA